MKTFIGLTPASFLKPRLNQSLTCALLLSFSTGSFAAVQAGELIISEIMANPSAVSDTTGEWFELYNPTANTIDLNGVSIYDAGSNNHTINQSLLIQSGSYLVMGRNADNSVNGGLAVDYVYSNFTLGNSSDDIFIDFMDVRVTTLSYGSGSVFGQAGVSAQWLGDRYELTPDNFTYGAGDTGTPGSQGSYDIPTASAVPIPAAGWFMASGLCSLLIGKNRRKVK